MSGSDAATSPSRSRVAGMVHAHQQAIERASAQPTSPTSQRKNLPDVNGDEAGGAKQGGDANKEDGDEVTTKEGGEPTTNDVKATAAKEDAKKASSEAAQSPKSASDRVLETVPEGKAGEGTNEAGESSTANTDERKESAAEGGDDANKDESKPAAVEEETQPLARILETLPSLGEKEQQVVQSNLERVAQYPPEMPLNTSWTLHFSDTSGTKSASAAAVKDAYTEGISPVFTATTVPALCGSLKAFKQAAGKVSRRSKAPEGESFGLTRPGMNLHFFRTGITPTWEDPYNEKGGRLTISPSAHLFDSIYERLILLLAGSALELSASDLLHSKNDGEPNANDAGKKQRTQANAQANGAPIEGMVNGVVASRRARGDRIEVWLGGKKKKEPAPGPWIDSLKEVLSDELGLPEVRTGKYKKHF